MMSNQNTASLSVLPNGDIVINGPDGPIPTGEQVENPKQENVAITGVIAMILRNEEGEWDWVLVEKPFGGTVVHCTQNTLKMCAAVDADPSVQYRSNAWDWDYEFDPKWDPVIQELIEKSK